MARPRIEHTEKIVELLGGRRVFGGRITDDEDMQDAVREGLPYGAFEALGRLVRPKDLVVILGMAIRTLARRKTSRHLTPVESDRLYRIALVTTLAAETLGSLDKAKAWLERENRALGGIAPLRLLDTEIGERKVEDTLRRIAHGVHS
jgi:putative toxin-antitoxin system antitoxin component (TIGR02293 family)